MQGFNIQCGVRSGGVSYRGLFCTVEDFSSAGLYGSSGGFGRPRCSERASGGAGGFRFLISRQDHLVYESNTSTTYSYSNDPHFGVELHISIATLPSLLQ